MQLKRFEKMRPRGRKVDLGDGQAAYVFPVGARHLVKFSKGIKTALVKLSQVEVPKGSSKDQMARAVGLEAIPIIAEDLLDLVKDTTVLGLLDQDDDFHVDEDASFDDLEHWNLPPLIEEWLDLSFGEDRKRKPWLQAVEKAIHRLTGEKMSISEMFSKDSSQQDTGSKTSLSVASETTTE